MKVSIIILSWNRKDDTLECLESLAKSNIKGFDLEVLVVDNKSTDGSQQALKKFIKSKTAVKNIKWRMIENGENLGFAEGNNVGMRDVLKKGADFVVLLNDDAVADKNLVSDLITATKKYPKAGTFTPKIYFAKDYEFHRGRYKKSELGRVIWSAGGDIDWTNIYGSNHGVDEVDKGQHGKVCETDFATGCCVLFRREVLEKVGLFDKKYFAYLEDVDLSQRIKKAGWKVLYAPPAKVWHKVAQSSGIGSELNDYFITRNRLLFGMCYASARTKFALIRESLKLLFNGRKWQKIGVRDFYLGCFGKGSWK